ncbi:MAG TPA: 2-oxo-4-hydroxy-4-carboxy-5-ureidoimidazoline decarboxylase [Candidatus Limnocylindria bacterium]|nr:2-oxo-4-hydroxy-4-carboxy-5-ureidoimidazoline decarboxylase [Candidatus Limnocylindria bacterium]
MGDRFPAIGELNRLTDSAFAEAVGVLFEGAPGFADRLAAERPFADDAGLLDAASRVGGSLSEAHARQLLDAHPRIGADPRSMSGLSYAEQGSTAAHQAATDRHVAAELARLNAAYEARFGFRYVIFVAGRPRTEVVPLLEAALERNRADELRRAVADCVAIAGDRLHRLRTEEDG